MAERVAPGAESQQLITSRDNRWLKQFRAALRGAGPSEGEPLAVEGPKLVSDALRSGLHPEALLLTEAAGNELETMLAAAVGGRNALARLRILRTTPKLFGSVTGTEAPQGVAALFRAPAWEFEDVVRGAANSEGARAGISPLVLVMAGVQDPGNVGTILRSVEAFGATGAVATRGTADPWSPKALRASAGSALRVPLLRGIALPVLLAQLKIARLKIFATRARPAGEDPSGQAKGAELQIADLREACAIFVGSEGAGLPAEVSRAADGMISIPMYAPVDSLNAGVAASIALFEAARQRHELS